MRAFLRSFFASLFAFLAVILIVIGIVGAKSEKKPTIKDHSYLVVDIHGDLADPGQRVHDDHPILGPRQRGLGDDV